MPNPETLTPPSRGVHYLGSDPELLNDLTALVEPKGLRVRGFSDVTDLAEAAAAPPAVLILDLGIMPSQATAEQLLIELYPKPGQRPELICIGGEDTMETRLKAMRAGAKGFIAAPVSPRRLAQKAIQLAGADRPEPYRILVVEDDAAQARYLALMLRNAGMTVDVVLEPLKVLNTMKEFHPDLVLMDLYLPGASGAELTAVIRDHDELYDIPIVFLSSEEDLDKQLDALRVGADSFMAKPVHRKALVGTIEHRIRMARWLKERRAEASRPEDASGLMRKDSFLRQLDRGLRNPQACGPGCGLVLLELDAHKQIFDRLGIVGTERLMRQVENQILKRLNPDEAAARLADFTYGVLARRPDPTKLQDLAERLRRGLAQGRVPGEGEPKHPTVSIGVGLFDPPADDALTMVSRARKAAKGARQEGGNRVRLWEPAVPAEPASEADTAMRALIEQALAKDGLKLQFQPIASVDREWDVLYEAQLRLTAPDGEHIPPADFLPVAERSRLIPAIDRWVLGRALDVLDAKRESHPGLRLMVHQTLETMLASDWLGWFRDQVAERNLIRQRPLLEVQLEDLRRRADQSGPLLKGLHKLGVQVSVANCTGSEEELRLFSGLNVSLVKLSFRTLSGTGEAELKEILGQLRNQGVASIAAGIEDPATIARVWACRPDYVQGNFLQLPSSDFGFELTQGDSATAAPNSVLWTPP